MTRPDRSIAVIGAGMGGVAIAALLVRHGWSVTVYEQAAQFARIGAGIQMTPNAVRVLHSLGIQERLEATAFAPRAGLARDWDSGAITNELPMGAEMDRKYGAHLLCMHRGDLHEALLSAAPGMSIRLGHKLVRLDQDADGIGLVFADGTSARAHAVIAADGVHSIVREMLFGSDEPRPTGRVAYRATFGAALLGAGRSAPVRTKWWGPDRHIVTYYVTRAEDEVYFVASVPEDASWRTPESWSAKGDLGELRAAFAGFHPDVQALLSACPGVHKWAVLERDPMPHWSVGRIALLGDACHPMTPYMSQGAAQAFEDAAVLSRCVDAAGPDRIADAFARYEATRRERTAEIQLTSRENKWMRKRTNADWVYGYDAWTAPLAPATRMPISPSKA